MKKNVVLIHFAFNFPIYAGTPYPPSGVLYVGDALKKAGYNVKVFHYHSTEMFTEADVEKIVNENPLFIGLSMVSGAPVYYGALFAEMVKAKRTEIPIIVGGVHPSLQPNECLELPYFDICVIGEGEETAVELAKAIEESRDFDSIPGIGYKKGDEIRINPKRPLIEDLDKYRQDWSLVDVKKYARKESYGTAFHLISSRGCPFKCGFCYNISFNPGRRWRAHSVNFVLDEIRNIHEQTGATIFTFNDDNFFANKKRGLEILEECQKLGITVDYVEVRIDSITEELIKKITDFGVKNIFIGWESGSDRTLREITKGYSRSLIIEKFKVINKIAPELIVSAYAIVGFPFEELSDWRHTLNTALEIHKIHPNTKIRINAYLPFPGTPQYEVALKHGFVPIKTPVNWLKISRGEKPKRPWLTPKMEKDIELMAIYSELLFTHQNVSSLVKLVEKVFAKIASVRLGSGCFSIPFDLKVRDLLLKVYKFINRK